MLPPSAGPHLRANILRLPPAVRAYLYQTSLSRRAFSATTGRPAWTDTVVAAPTAALDAVHSLGVPWYAAIPITAIVVRGTLGYYVATLPARRRQIIRNHLFPLTSVRGKIKEKSIDGQWYDWRRKHSERRMIPDSIVQISRFVHVRLNFIRESHRTGKAFGAPLVSWRSFFNFGMMIAFVEAIRIKCGTREGLLSLLLGSTQSVQETAAQTNKVTQNMTPDEILAYRLETAHAAQKAKLDSSAHSAAGSDVSVDKTAQQYLLDNTQSTEAINGMRDVQLAPLDTKAYAQFLDPTLQTEGIGWIQDLTLPDTTFILPVTMSAVIVANVLLRPMKTVSKDAANAEQLDDSNQPLNTVTKDVRPKDAEDMSDNLKMAYQAADELKQSLGTPRAASNKLTLGQRIGLVMSLLFFLVATNLPAAILLYIVPTVMTGFVQRRWLDQKYPLPKPLMPCARPLRVKVRQELTDR